jgi:hypothetical protein
VRTVESFAPVLCFCRSDTRFANVIERPDGRLGWIDWEDSGLRDPALELTDVICHVNQEDLLTWEEWQPLIQMYIAARQTVDPGIAERMHVYLAIFPLFWLSVLLPIGVQHAESGTLSGWRVNEMEPQVRLRRLLARALVWPKMEFERELAALEDLLFFPEVHS